MKLTKYFIISILLLLVGFDVYGQTELENKVIATLLDNGKKLIPEYKLSKRKGRIKTFNRHRHPAFVLMNATQSPLLDAEFDTLGMFERKVLLNDDRDMLNDFCAKNKASLNIDFDIEAENKITALRKAELKKLFVKKDDWHLYYKKFNLKPLVSISRPGFNKKQNKAFIYITYSLGKDEGAGYYLVMKKSWGKWRIKGPMLIWIA